MLIFHEHPVQGAIFDMDGTMFDTERLRFKTLKDASKALIGQEFSDDYLMQCLGLSATTAEQLAKQLYGQDIPYKEIRHKADELELEYVRNHGVPIKKGLFQVLERLRKSGLRMAVATSSRRAIAEEYLINAHVYKFFDLLVCGDEVEKGKPHPEIFIKAVEQVNLQPQNCLMFEDSENGITSAHDAKGITILLKDIKSPNQNMLSKANFYYDTMYDFLEDLDQFIPAMEMPKIQESFPQTLNQLTVGIHGFGAIGGGYLAQILSHWDGYTRPKRIYASTRNRLILEAVNAFGNYCIRYGQISYDEQIDYVQVISADDANQMQTMYIKSTLIALCLPEQAIASEAVIIAHGLYARYQADNSQPITFLIILNKVGAKAVVIEHIRQALLALTLNDEALVSQILGQHYFCDTVVNRMVSKLSDQNLYRQLKIKYNFLKQYQNEYEDDHFDTDDMSQLSTEQEHQVYSYIEDIRQNFQPSHVLQSIELILFQSEIDMPIYVENHSPLLKKLRQMILVDDIGEIQLIKNRLWNGTHAILAWYASLLGYESIGVAIGDQRIRGFVNGLISEIETSLKAVLPQRAHDLDRLAQSFIHSCEYAFKDPCERVARDPLRKLQANERVFGSLETNIRQGFSAEHLITGVAFGFLYATEKLNIAAQEVWMHVNQSIQNLSLTPEQQEQLIQHIKQQVVHLEVDLQQDKLITSGLLN